MVVVVVVVVVGFRCDVISYHSVARPRPADAANSSACRRSNADSLITRSRSRADFQFSQFTRKLTYRFSDLLKVPCNVITGHQPVTDT